VLQFGNVTNDDLEEMTYRTPGGNYNYANKRSIGKIMETQLPPKMPDANTVFYTDMGKATGSELIEGVLKDITR
jgi:hypothetical protein